MVIRFGTGQLQLLSSQRFHSRPGILHFSSHFSLLNKHHHHYNELMVFIVHAANFTLLHIAASHITSQPHSTGCVLLRAWPISRNQQHHVLQNKLSKILQYLLAINILGIHIASFIKNYHYQISHHKASLHVVISLRSKTDAILSTQHNQLYAIIICIQHTSGHSVPSHLRIHIRHTA